MWILPIKWVPERKLHRNNFVPPQVTGLKYQISYLKLYNISKMWPNFGSFLRVIILICTSQYTRGQVGLHWGLTKDKSINHGLISSHSEYEQLMHPFSTFPIFRQLYLTLFCSYKKKHKILHYIVKSFLTDTLRKTFFRKQKVYR